MTMKTLTLVCAGLAGLLSLACQAAGVPPERKAGYDPDRKIERIRSFRCETNAVPVPQHLSDIEDAPGSTLQLNPTTAPCDFTLLHSDANGHQVEIPTAAPGGYLVAIGRALPNGARLVCASKIVHKLAKGASEKAASQKRRIESVPIECSVNDGTRWSQLATVVDGGDEWAAWALGILHVGPNHYRVIYTRDFSFQLMNLGDVGRPAEDGIYETDFELTPDGPRPTGTRKVSDKTVPDVFLSASPSDTPMAELEDTGRCPPPGGCIDVPR